MHDVLKSVWYGYLTSSTRDNILTVLIFREHLICFKHPHKKKVSRDDDKMDTYVICKIKEMD